MVNEQNYLNDILFLIRRMVPGGLPLLGLIHLADVALIQAPRGSCGVISTLRTIGSRNTEVLFLSLVLLFYF